MVLVFLMMAILVLDQEVEESHLLLQFPFYPQLQLLQFQAHTHLHLQYQPQHMDHLHIQLQLPILRLPHTNQLVATTIQYQKTLLYFLKVIETKEALKHQKLILAVLHRQTMMTITMKMT